MKALNGLNLMAALSLRRKRRSYKTSESLYEFLNPLSIFAAIQQLNVWSKCSFDRRLSIEEGTIMSFVRIWVHAVSGTKCRDHVLTEEVRYLVFKHIKEHARTKNIYVDSIGGYTDHVHILLSLDTDQSIAWAMNIIKGESSHWFNKRKTTKLPLYWADEFFAISVSESVIDKVRKYIESQSTHHRKKTFQEEIERFTRSVGHRPPP